MSILAAVVQYYLAIGNTAVATPGMFKQMPAERVRPARHLYKTQRGSGTSIGKSTWVTTQN